MLKITLPIIPDKLLKASSLILISSRNRTVVFSYTISVAKSFKARKQIFNIYSDYILKKQFIPTILK